MTKIKLKHIDRFKDRHGRMRYFFRKGKGPRLPLTGEPGSPEFMASYQAAIEGQFEAPAAERHRGGDGTFDRLVENYFRSPEYLNLSERSRYTYRSIIERLIEDEKIGPRQVAQMQREHVKKIIARRADRPGAADNALKKLRILMNFAIESGWRSDNPAANVKGFKLGTWHTWTDEEVAAFEARWTIGTPERTAFALLLYTGQRLGDVVGMQWKDITTANLATGPRSEGVGDLAEDEASHVKLIRVAQEKTGTQLYIPVHAELLKALDSHSNDNSVIIANSLGNPFSSAGFGNWMADKIGEAELPDRCVTHGIRKAAARRLAEAGCTSKEIAAITGHKSLREIERYTAGAEQRILAASAMGRLKGR